MLGRVNFIAVIGIARINVIAILLHRVSGYLLIASVGTRLCRHTLYRRFLLMEVWTRISSGPTAVGTYPFRRKLIAGITASVISRYLTRKKQYQTKTNYYADRQYAFHLKFQRYHRRLRTKCIHHAVIRHH